MILFLDTETFSATPIKHGTYRYAEDAEVMLATWAIDDGPVEAADFTAGASWQDFEALVDSADVIVAHNAMFDRNVIARGSRPHPTPITKWRCCMVKALLHGLPGGLDKLCSIVGVPEDQAKLKDGKALVRLFCQPRPKNTKIRRATRLTHPAEWARFVEYAKNDITAMREVWKRLPSWNYGETGAGALERDLWHLDQEINDRGVLVDIALVEAAIRATDAEQTRLRDRTAEHTDGYVGAATQRDRMLEFIFAEYGVGLKDLTGSTVSKMLDREDIPPGMRELLRIRDQASQTSTAKYNAFRNAANDDGRVRGMLQFSGAARTRRDAGRTVQLQNLPSRGLLPHDQVEIGIEAMLHGAEDVAFDNVMLLTASTIRSVIIPTPGNKVVVSDLSNIEGRGVAWLSGEEWKLQAFRDFDTCKGLDGAWYSGEALALAARSGKSIGLERDEKGDPVRKGHDLYKLAYAKSFGVKPESVDTFGRSIGKVQELALGYAGGINAFVTFSLAYGMDLEAMADKAWDSLPDDVRKEATSFVEWLTTKKKQKFPMSDRAATVCDAFKRMWRAAHPETVKLWAAMEEGFKDATATPGETFEYRGLKFRRDGAWLRIRLPSGRCLCYPSPKVDDKGQCYYMGVNQFTRKWEMLKTYSGKLVENATQSIARDFLFDNLRHVEAAGYRVVMRVHDELVTEVPDSPEFSADGLSALLSATPEWGTGMPLAAAGFEADRYRKD